MSDAAAVVAVIVAVVAEGGEDAVAGRRKRGTREELRCFSPLIRPTRARHHSLLKPKGQK